MMARFVVSGTDTGIGKTVFSAALANALCGYYWKPVQSGLDEETDTQTVRRLGDVPEERIVSEAYRLATPVSPHLSARIDGTSIDAQRLVPPQVDGPLVIEGAGGLMVPLAENLVFADVFAQWQIPVILCARTTLGTINHTLLSIEAMHHRAIPIFGIAFIGEANPETETVIARLSGVRPLGRLPILASLKASTVSKAFHENFDLNSFADARP
ncbi:MULTISPECIES: dethiobiotin synthase [unclassified Rhizobium]|jgi:dethiobiotin synthetase|uniref:dethiobiotin synthase n=1 Tax=Hyphomicrobiales TaxID=356 RepID=UPI0006469AC2|nr:dethiobiotin synthase [Rhizobium sp. WW_1]RKD74038.1 dethiobiotin synthetase [Rhizobium sp. WW_1]